MGKQHKHNKLYITANEWKENFGGKKDEIIRRYRKLPFNYCALSLQPFDNPMCAEDGTIFDIENIVPYIQEHHVHPRTGEQLKLKDLFPLHFHKNTEGEYHCPVTFKVFNEHTHIVAIKKTGNVFSRDAIEKMVLQINNWKDPLNEEVITRDDLITIQDPNDMFTKEISHFYHIKKKEDGQSQQDEKNETDPTSHINANAATNRIFQEMKKKEEERKKMEEQKKKLEQDKSNLRKTTKTLQSGKSSTENQNKDTSSSSDGQKNSKKTSNIIYSSQPSGPDSTTSKSASFTSTVMSIRWKDDENKTITTAEGREEKIRNQFYEFLNRRKKNDTCAFVTLTTTLGDLNFELHCGKAPKTCDNFLSLCEKGYYNNTIFHRVIKGFMAQGGDPTGTGRGGKSIWERNFEDEFHPTLKHDDVGILSMANSGKNTNSSQFFITFKKQHHLNNKHTVFGKLVGGSSVLAMLEQVETDPSDRPIKPIKISKTMVYSNPFKNEALRKEFEKKYEIKPSENSMLSEEEKKVGSWFSNPAPALVAKRTGVGKYIDVKSLSTQSVDLSFLASIPKDNPDKKRLASDTLNDGTETQHQSNETQQPSSSSSKKQRFDFSKW